MDFKIDLKELSIRESEKVEWKENGNDKDVVKSIVKTISAFANDIANIGGGYIVCGAKETKDEFGFPKVIYTGLSSNKLKEIEGKVLAHCRDQVSPSLSPLVQEMDNPEDKSTAKWRNQSFAYLFNKLQLAQSEGQGIPTIFRTMHEEGCPQPIFEIGTESVTCILPAHPRHGLLRSARNDDKIKIVNL